MSIKAQTVTCVRIAANATLDDGFVKTAGLRPAGMVKPT